MGKEKGFFFIKLSDTLPEKSRFFETFSFQTLRLWFELSAESWEGLEEQPASVWTTEPLLHH